MEYKEKGRIEMNYDSNVGTAKTTGTTVTTTKRPI